MDNEGCYVFTNLPLILFRIGIIKIPILKNKFPKNTLKIQIPFSIIHIL